MQLLIRTVLEATISFLGWLSALYSQLMFIYGGLNFIAGYKIVVNQNTAEPQAQYSWSSISITCLMVTVFSLKQWNLQSDNLHADYYSFRSDSDSVTCVLLFHQVSSLVYTLQCNAVTSDVLYSGYFQFVFKALTLKVDGSLS